MKRSEILFALAELMEAVMDTDALTVKEKDEALSHGGRLAIVLSRAPEGHPAKVELDRICEDLLEVTRCPRMH